MANIQTSGAISLTPPVRSNICIASPAYKSVYTGAYVESLFPLIVELRRRGIGLAFVQVDYADIVVARNYLISRFYFDYPACTHLLFLDNDMGFGSELIMDMLALNENVVGVILPKRKINLEKLHANGDKPFAEAYASACEFIGKPSPAGQQGRFVKTKRVGTGILLIKREAVATMIEKCPEINKRTKIRGALPSNLGGYVTPFDKMRVGDHELSEDFSFCHRWTELCGGTILASTSSPIKHVGELTIETKLADTWIAPQNEAP